METPEDHTATANDDSDEQLLDSPVQQPEIRQPSPFNFLGAMRRLGGNPTSMFSMVDQVDDMLPAGPVLSERAGGGARLSIILHIIHIMHIVHILIIWFTQATRYADKSFKIHSIRLQIFAFATSETLSINSGNRLMQAVANVRYIMCNIFLVFE